jgi:hypothetical protein
MEAVTSRKVEQVQVPIGGMETEHKHFLRECSGQTTLFLPPFARVEYRLQ